MLKPDTTLPLRDLAWSRSRIRDLLDREVLPRLRPGTRVRELEREYTAYKAGKDCQVLYTVHTQGHEGAEAMWVSLTLGPPERLRTLWSRHYEHKDPDAARALLLDLPCLVETFPSDWKLRDLRAAADPVVAAELLGLEPGEQVEVERLRYRPRRRCVLGYRVDPSGKRDAVAKVYHDDQKAAEVREKLARLGPEARRLGLDLPELRGRVGDRAIVLMERLPGDNVSDVLQKTHTTAEARPLITLSARALAVFHALPPHESEPRCFENEIGALRTRGGRLAEVSPKVERQVQTLIDRVEKRLNAVGSEPLRLIHGDYKPSQLLVCEGRPALVDLDRACLGDPALDLGNFLAVLTKQVMLRDQPHVLGLGKDFLATYEQHAVQPAHLERARLFEAFALTRMLVRKIERAPYGLARQGDAWTPLVLLEEARSRLDALGVA